MADKWIHNTSVATKTYQGREVESGSYFQIPFEAQLAFAMDADLVEDVLAGIVAISWNGSDDFTNLWAGVNYLQSFPSYQSSFAVDKNDDTPQTVSSSAVTLVVANRVLWDLQAEYTLAQSKFSPSLDGVWNMNGTVTVGTFVNVAWVKLHIYRNASLYFTVVDQAVAIDSKRAFTFTCDVDAYASEGHEFDLRIELEPVDGLLPVSAVISGSDEETAWGMTFLQALTQASPT